MKDDQLDRIFSGDQDLVPSSGFARNVMDAVRREASSPAPIPFPWKRALPGLVLCVLALAATCVEAFLRSGTQRLPATPGPSIWSATWTALWTGLSNLVGLLRAANAGGLGWIVLALLLTLASIMLSLRLTGRRA
jgi:hypothetical protein